MIGAARELLQATLRHGEHWDRVSRELSVDPVLARRLYKTVRDSMTDSSQPWSAEEDDLLLRLLSENSPQSRLLATTVSVQYDDYSHFALWRNISHWVGRSSVDCRLRARALERRGSGTDATMGATASSAQLDESVDSWHVWEVTQLAALIGPPGQVDVPFAQVGRHLGRTSRQCYLCYRSAQYSAQYSALAAHEVIQKDDFPPSIALTSAPATVAGQVSASTRGWSSRRWTTEEDALLVSLVRRYGASWALISAHMRSRVPSSCFARYRLLSHKEDLKVEALGLPSSTVTDGVAYGETYCPIDGAAAMWTDEKKAQLTRLVSLYGARWTWICRVLGPGYSPYSARTVYMRMALSRPDELLIPVRSRSTSIYTSASTDASEHASSTRFNFVNATVVLASQRAAAVRRSARGEGGRKWTREDDRLLTQLAQQHGRNWNLVAEQMNRSPEDVMMRFDFKLSAHRHGSWTKQEDARLIEFVEQHGDAASGWSRIGDELNRSAAQCALRWRVTLDPRLKWRPWSAEEDERLRFLREERGYTWVMISASLDRASSSCRYRYSKLTNANKN